MHVFTNDGFTGIDDDQLTAVTGGTGDGNNPSPDDDNKKKKGRGFGALSVIKDAVEFITRPPSDEFQAYKAYQAEAHRSRLLSDAYSGGRSK